MNSTVVCRVNVPHLHRKFIRIEAKYPSNADVLVLQLPVWRPGRYERADFAKNIKSWQAFGTQQEKLAFKKTGLSTWEVATSGSPEITIVYEYYANILNAGSSFVNEDLLYINPVNCFLFDPVRPFLSFQIELDIPDDWSTATGMQIETHRLLSAKDFQQLADCPILSSPNLAHLQYTIDRTVFHLRVYGELAMERHRILEDFKRFTEAQLRAFGSFPEPEYHFLFLLTPWAHYHGVEHENSTVIVLGPAANISEGNLYSELLGICSHELYHTWNVKKIRPLEMQPYDFSLPALSELGFVTEGVTTYFGDQFLHRCGLLSDQQYFGELEKLLDKHFDNPGRENYSLAQSSFDTWLDGYSAGIPWRKVSIYNEGALCAFIADVTIIKHSENRRSLDDVMRLMNKRYGVSGIGYTESDYLQALEETSGISFSWLFDQLIHGTESYFTFLLQAFESIGLELAVKPSEKAWEGWLGIRLDEKMEILGVLPDSPADRAGLWPGMKILSWNGIAIAKTSELSAHIDPTEQIKISFSLNGKIAAATVEPEGIPQYKKHLLRLKEHPGEEKLKAFHFWKYRLPLDS
jgi:predicted metalloprotease with PDZ domain